MIQSDYRVPRVPPARTPLARDGRPPAARRADGPDRQDRELDTAGTCVIMMGDAGAMALGTVPRDPNSNAYNGRAIRRTFDELGWVVLPELFSEEQLLPMQRRMERHVEAAAERLGAPPATAAARFDRRLLEIMQWADKSDPKMTPHAAGLLGLAPFAVKDGDADDVEAGGRAVFDLVTHSPLLEALSALLGPSITYLLRTACFACICACVPVMAVDGGGSVGGAVCVSQCV